MAFDSDKPASILVIEDDALTGSLILRLLKSTGYDAIHAMTGQAGIAMAEEFRPNVILLDYNLPDTDGRAVCADLKSRLATSDIPVIFVTASERTDEMVTQCFEAGASDFINKPINRVDLFARLKVVLREQALREAYRQLATQDPLTGLANRRQFMLHVMEATHGSRVDKTTSVLLFCDVDHFKAINDRYGHNFGDEVILTFARLLKRFDSSICHTGRMGGEEFALVLKKGSLAEGEALAERLCSTFGAVVFDAETEPKQFTVSIGVAAYDGTGEKCDADLLLKQSDIALYAAKSAGRNRVCAYWKLDSEARKIMPPPEHRHARSRPRVLEERAYIRMTEPAAAPKPGATTPPATPAKH